MTQMHPLENLYQEELYNIRGKILVLIRKPWADITEDEKTLLTKILSSVKLSLASVQIINRAEFDAVDFSAFRPDCIIAFGSTLKTSNKMYEKIVQNDVAIVVADELDQLDDVRKRNLWLTLKQLFHS
ncbi:MAG TPA: hypothetical protein VFD46_06750 [Chryseolinea sp.]|nr:hypothetical protein [Chryseolinea sp.]